MRNAVNFCSKNIDFSVFEEKEFQDSPLVGEKVRSSGGNICSQNLCPSSVLAYWS